MEEGEQTDGRSKGEGKGISRSSSKPTNGIATEQARRVAHRRGGSVQADAAAMLPRLM
jgi:hypothetical protein